jgi:apolipoprotein N-acyltransferase
MPNGDLVLTPEEASGYEQEQAEQEKLRADRLAEKLRQLGIDPNEE